MGARVNVVVFVKVEKINPNTLANTIIVKKAIHISTHWGFSDSFNSSLLCFFCNQKYVSINQNALHSDKWNLSAYL